MAHFVKCLIKIHNQAIGLSAYIQVVCDVINKPVGYHRIWRVPSESHAEVDLVFGVGPHGS
jgi:hypothetical protein